MGTEPYPVQGAHRAESDMGRREAGRSVLCKQVCVFIMSVLDGSWLGGGGACL